MSGYITSMPGFFPPPQPEAEPAIQWILGTSCQVMVDRFDREHPQRHYHYAYRGILRNLGDQLMDFDDTAFVPEEQADGSKIIWLKAYLPRCNWSGLGTLEIWRGKDQARPLKVRTVELRELPVQE